jgi:hypothetical protein
LFEPLGRREHLQGPIEPVLGSHGLCCDEHSRADRQSESPHATSFRLKYTCIKAAASAQGNVPRHIVPS